MKKEIFLFLLIGFLFKSYGALEILDQAGEYIYGNNLVFDSTSNDDSAFIIAASDVTLDLNGNVLSQMEGNTQTGINGITVNPNLANITIRNGTIQSLTGSGIIVNEGCSTLLIEDVTIRNCDGRGLAFLGTSNARVTDYEIRNTSILGCAKNTINSDSALFIEFSRGFRLSNMRVNNNGNSARDLSNIRIDNSDTARIFDVRCNNNFGNTNVFGLHLSTAQNIFFVGLLARNNRPFATNGLSVVFELQETTSCTGNFFQNCISFVNTATTSGGRVIGYRLGQTCNNNIFQDCFTLQNTADSDVIGFSISNVRTNFFQRCNVRENISTNGNAMGVFVLSCTDLGFIEGLSNENRASNGTARGFDIRFCSNCSFRNNTAIRNQGSSDANSFGFRIEPGLGGTNTPPGENAFVSNISIRNGVTLGGNQPADSQYFGFNNNQRDINTNENSNSLGGFWKNAGFR